MSDTIADILERAAARVEKGWTQQGMEDRAGNVCALKAIDLAMGGRCSISTPAYDAFCEFIGRAGIGIWNDAPGRTQQEVVAALREAARLAREPKP